MKIPEFDRSELKIVGGMPSPFGAPDTPIYNYPIPAADSVRLLYERKPAWQMLGVCDTELPIFTPAIIPDNVARAFVFDATYVPGESNQCGGKDMFGIDWEYVPSAGGSIVRPGKPFAEDMDDLLEKIVWPDPADWDWEGARKTNEAYIQSLGKPLNTWFLTGYFERLISLLDFENAVVALIDEDEQEGVHTFFDKLSNLYIDIIGRMIKTFPEIEVYYIHDDWGSQRASFFSPKTGKEMIVPYMKRVNDFIHAQGRYCHLHSCGHLMNQVDNFIAAGWDAWEPQLMNDIEQLYKDYGDRILLGTVPDYDPQNATEAEQRAAARAYAEKYCHSDKPSFLNFYAASAGRVTPAFSLALYEYSRLAYEKDRRDD